MAARVRVASALAIFALDRDDARSVAAAALVVRCRQRAGRTLPNAQSLGHVKPSLLNSVRPQKLCDRAVEVRTREQAMLSTGSGIANPPIQYIRTELKKNKHLCCSLRIGAHLAGIYSRNLP